jgi:hypothetical protein
MEGLIKGGGDDNGPKIDVWAHSGKFFFFILITLLNFAYTILGYIYGYCHQFENHTQPPPLRQQDDNNRVRTQDMSFDVSWAMGMIFFIDFHRLLLTNYNF